MVVVVVMTNELIYLTSYLRLYTYGGDDAWRIPIGEHLYSCFAQRYFSQLGTQLVERTGSPRVSGMGRGDMERDTYYS